VADNPHTGGDHETSTPAISTAAGNSAELHVPEQPGNYRVFVYVFDPKGRAATANVPIQAK
jgi:hypothetical protein